MTIMKTFNSIELFKNCPYSMQNNNNYEINVINNKKIKIDR